MDVAPWGGSEELWSQTAEMMTLGYQIACSIHSWPQSHLRIKQLENSGVRILPRIKYKSKALHLLNFFLPSFLQIKKKCPFCHAIDDFNPDLVVISQGGTSDGLVAMKVCRDRRIPYTIVVQAVPESTFWEDDIILSELVPLYHGALKVYFVAKRNQSFLEVKFATRLSNAKIIFNPFNVRYLAEPTWPKDDQSLHLACVARMEFYAKGQDLLLKLMSIKKWQERPVTLTFFGSGPNSQILQKTISNEGLNNVFYGGFSSNIEELWTRYHALVLPSRHEGLPLALVEAFLCRRPAVVSPVGGNAELVIDGFNGYVTKGCTLELLDEAMERLWQNRTALRELGENARETAVSIIPADPARSFAEELISLLTKNNLN